ncbi:MAG: hypothetical protein ACRDRV_12185 [Pseudonocardiaceae bacterium]
MSTATLNVWITAFGDPCHIVREQASETWYVHVLDCAGQPLEWCGRRYLNIVASCGQAEFQLPPGCYAVLASHTFVQNPVAGFGNRLTHVGVVRVNCGDHACVTLFSPSAWFCGTWFAKALQGYAQAGALNPAVVQQAVPAIEAVLHELPTDPFSAATLELDTHTN